MRYIVFSLLYFAISDKRVEFWMKGGEEREFQVVGNTIPSLRNSVPLVLAKLLSATQIGLRSAKHEIYILLKQSANDKAMQVPILGLCRAPPRAHASESIAETPPQPVSTSRCHDARACRFFHPPPMNPLATKHQIHPGTRRTLDSVFGRFKPRPIPTQPARRSISR